MKVKNFLRICFSLFVFAMTALNISVMDRFYLDGWEWAWGWAGIVEVVIAGMSYYAYATLLQKHDGEERL